MDKLETYEEETNRKLAQKIWDIPFASSNLDKLTKQELLILIYGVLERVSDDKKEWYELDLKDLLFEEKCWLITTLDPEFFENKE